MKINFRETLSKLRVIIKKRRLPISEIYNKFNIRATYMPLPLRAQIEPTTKCNFKCITCSRTSLAHSRLNKDLSLKEFKYIINQIPTLKTIQLQGLGEPLLSKDIWRIAKYAKINNIYISTTINGSLINEKTCDKLLTHFNEIRISLDSINEENYNKIRKGGNYQKLLSNLQLLIDKMKYYQIRPILFLTFVSTYLNFNELEKYFKLCLNLNINCGVVEVENWYIPKQKQYKDEIAFIKKSRAYHDKIRTKIAKYSVKFNEAGLLLKYISSLKRKRTCFWPFIACFITCDGYITPCCIRQDPKVFNLGNIFHMPFKEIWNSKIYKILRNTMIKDLKNSICDKCPD